MESAKAHGIRGLGAAIVFDIIIGALAAYAGSVPIFAVAALGIAMKLAAIYLVATS